MGVIRGAAGLVGFSYNLATNPGGTFKSTINGLDALLLDHDAGTRTISNVTSTFSDLVSSDPARIESGTLRAGVTAVSIAAVAVPRSEAFAAFRVDASAPSGAVAAEEIAAEGAPLIGNSGFRSIGEFSDAVTSKYQSLYDQHYSGTMRLVDQGLIPNDPLVIGGRTDALVRTDLRDWLSNGEGIQEDPGQIIQVNRRLYDPLGT